MEEGPMEPVSWLRLERYHLGELRPEEAAQVERALAVDAEARECLEQIRQPVALRPLPEPPSRARVVKLRAARAAWWPFLSLAAAVAGAALVVWVKSTEPEVLTERRSFHVKGGDVVVSLVREREGAIASSPATFAEGDRFKVLLTCPPTLDGDFDVVVFQDAAPSFPFAGPATLVCGNSVPIPGAFTLTGASPATVCVVRARDVGARRGIERGGLDKIRDSAACVALTPE
jgi:hypothetical protein